MAVNPNNDGVDHINVYSGGKTELGKFLSNFAKTPIQTPEGLFQSVEGYWHYLGTNHPDRDQLKKLYGNRARTLGKEMREEYPAHLKSTPNYFRDKIAGAIKVKLLNNTEMLQALQENKLPLRHYYVFGGKPVEPNEDRWVLAVIDDLAKNVLKPAPKKNKDPAANYPPVRFTTDELTIHGPHPGGPTSAPTIKFRYLGYNQLDARGRMTVEVGMGSMSKCCVVNFSDVFTCLQRLVEATVAGEPPFDFDENYIDPKGVPFDGSIKVDGRRIDGLKDRSGTDSTDDDVLSSRSPKNSRQGLRSRSKSNASTSRTGTTKSTTSTVPRPTSGGSKPKPPFRAAAAKYKTRK